MIDLSDRYLYKAKGQTDNKWHIGYMNMLNDNVVRITECEYLHSTWICDSSTLCQCTGLKDKNGNLIWENDIIKNTANIYWDLQIVKYGACRNWIIDGVGNKPFKASRCGCLVDIEATLIFEVIGNTFDNPGLLEV